MQTIALYDNQSHLREFDAEILDCQPVSNGWAVILDQTAFYPEGGGQPSDRGALGGRAVLDVQKVDGQIVHLCDGPLAVGERVHGAIDWQHRFDLMQQHSGEHIVSGLIHNRFGYDNVGFHMGAEVMTIDFSGPITHQQLMEIEQEANEIVWENQETEILYPTQEELAQIAYRSKKALTGQVRLVRYPGVDVCACCGTHVDRTGEIGPIKLLSCVRFHEGVRVELICGGRAMDYLRAVAEQNRQISGLLSAKPLETAHHVQRLMEELERVRYELNGCRMELIDYKAATFAHQGRALCFEENLTMEQLRRLAGAIDKQVEGVCVVFSGNDKAGYQYAIAHKNGDVRDFTKKLNERLGGRGGGKPAFTQGWVGASRAAIEEFFAECWK